MHSVAGNMFEKDFTFEEPFALESGDTVSPLNLRCSVYGELNADCSNAVLVFHALTGSSRIADWWGDVLGAGRGLDTSKYALLCVNYPGSCYGSTTAKTLKERCGKLPVVTTRDIVCANIKVAERLGIKKFKAAVGGSVGGMLALQLAADFPDLTAKCIAIGATPLSPLGLALNHLQRQALRHNDIGLARQAAMLSYKCAALLDERFARNPNRNGEDPYDGFESRFDVAGYLDYQGEIFEKRFETESYELITKTMDLFELVDEEIAKIKAVVSLIGISSDWLFPASDVKSYSQKLKSLGVKTEYIELVSNDGHDAFLSDADLVSDILKEVLARESTEGKELEQKLYATKMQR